MFPTSSVRGSLAHSSRTPPSLCLNIVPYRSRCLAMTPNVRYLPFYSSLLLLLWSPILPKPQAPLATPHHFLDSAYTLFPPRVPITRFVSLAYPPILPIISDDALLHMDTSCSLLHLPRSLPSPSLRITKVCSASPCNPFLVVDIPPVTPCFPSFFSLCLCSVAIYISCL